jgi:hypothetical protein
VLDGRGSSGVNGTPAALTAAPDIDQILKLKKKKRILKTKLKKKYK